MAVHGVYEEHIAASVLNNADLVAVVCTPDLVPKVSTHTANCILQ